MRSIKSQLFEFVKTAIMGGVFTDNLDKVYTFDPILDIQLFEFWNDNLNNFTLNDNYIVPAVFFEFASINNEKKFFKDVYTPDYQTSKDVVMFNLHLITGKYSSEMRDNDYLDSIDLADKLFSRLENKSFSNCKNILKVSEVADRDSSVLMDWVIQFNCLVSNAGEGDVLNANDLIINPNAPVEMKINAIF